jgi:hypothetical protein
VQRVADEEQQPGDRDLRLNVDLDVPVGRAGGERCTRRPRTRL